MAAAAVTTSFRRVPLALVAAAMTLTTTWIVGAQPAPTTAPAATSQPATQPSVYDRLLGNVDVNDRVETPILPVSAAKMMDASTGIAAVAPGAPQLATRREGTILPRVIGRMTKSPDPAGGWEFTIESDGQALQDPPLKLLPNLKLMAMEEQRETLNRDVRFRVSGTITEYRGRNYLLVEEAVVVRDPP